MIEGLEHLEKEGWELVRVGIIHPGEHWVGSNGSPLTWQSEHSSTHLNFPVIRKIEKPKQYRPFANAAEFRPHRDRWIYSAEQKNDNPEGAESPEDEYLRVLGYSDSGVTIDEYGFCFDTGLRYFVFADDGSPFGVEVQS